MLYGKYQIINKITEDYMRDIEEMREPLPHWIQMLNEVLEEHMDNQLLTNEFLANQLEISERKFYRTIKNLTGLSPNLYIRKLKLQYAHDLLLTGNYLTVKEVLLKIGMKSIKYFYLIFKQQFGYPPGSLLKERGLK